MSAISDIFQQAQLSEAAYVNFIANDGSLISNRALLIDALKAEGISENQAIHFLQNWRVVSQFSEIEVLSNGFSATLFERLNTAQQPTGQYTLAFEGSTWKSLGVDFVGADLDLAVTGVALNQVVSMVNYVLRLQVGSNGATRQLSPLATGLTSGLVNGIGPGINPTQIAVAGHSLGGYLSQIYQRIFGGVSSYTYNALGVTNVNAVIFDRVTDLLGLPRRGFSSGEVENLVVAGEPAQLIGTVQGKPQIKIFSEMQATTLDVVNTVQAHKIPYLVDSLAVYDIFIRLSAQVRNTAPATALITLKPLFEAGSAQADSSLERIVDALVKLFQLGFPPLTGGLLDKRDELYKRILPLQAITKNLSDSNSGE